jgi:SAM-dependent methyltransferase
MSNDPLHFYRTASARDDHTAPWYVAARLQELFRRVDIEGRVLDVGCGVGGNQAALAALGLPAAGIDVSERSLKELRANHPGVPAAAADAGRLPFADASFGGAVITEVLEHVADPARVLDEVARVVRPGGALFVTSPNYANPTGLRKAWRDWRSGGHDWNPWEAHKGGYEAFMTRRRLRAVVERGFDVLWEEGLEPGLGLTAGLPVFVRLATTPRGERLLDRIGRSGAFDPDRRVSRWFGMNTALLARRRGGA